MTVEAACIRNDILIASYSEDQTIKLWKSTGGSYDFACIQTIQENPSQFCFAMKLFAIPSQNEVLLLKSAGEQLQLWAQSENEFSEVIRLFGHEDWIRCVDAIVSGQDIMIMTGGQDHYVRIWKLCPKSNVTPKESRIHMEEKLISIGNNKFSVNLESVLSGHEGWVYAANFFQNNDTIGIMTCSIDKSIIIWYQGESGIWMDTHRIGEMGGGGLGFLGAKTSLDGHTIVAHGFQGSLHIWTIEQGEDGELIKPENASSGHFGSVTGIAWAPDGEYLFSISSDQTTRIHAPSKNEDNSRWSEIARVQIHGYDLTSIAVLASDKIATGAEEKVIRIFQGNLFGFETFYF